jgi:hypothetical protein
MKKLGKIRRRAYHEPSLPTHFRQSGAMKSGISIATLGLVCVLTGCRSIGPRTVARDRFDYSASLGESWKRQTLLNIVKLRYLDPPIFVDVGQIVSGYQLQTTANVGGQISSEGAVQGNGLLLGGSGTFVDRPTITYTPLTGNKFIKGLMTPLSPESVFFTIQSGWPADAVLFATVAEMNGLDNQTAGVNGVSPPDPKFMRALELIRRIQLSDAVAMRIREDAANQQTTLLSFRSKDISPETLNDIHELRALLRLDPDAPEIRLVFAPTAVDKQELALITRSILQLMSIMASGAEVPLEDVAQGRAAPGWESVTNSSTSPQLIRIRCSKSEPSNAFVAIPYRNHWFWVDDSDLKSKRTFSFMMLLFTLADTGQTEPLPLVTIPAQ